MLYIGDAHAGALHLTVHGRLPPPSSDTSHTPHMPPRALEEKRSERGWGDGAGAGRVERCEAEKLSPPSLPAPFFDNGDIFALTKSCEAAAFSSRRLLLPTSRCLFQPQASRPVG